MPILFLLTPLLVDYEIKRQTDVLSSGGKVVQETRNFDAATGYDYVVDDAVVESINIVTRSTSLQRNVADSRQGE